MPFYSQCSFPKKDSFDDFQPWIRFISTRTSHKWNNIACTIVTGSVRAAQCL